MRLDGRAERRVSRAVPIYMVIPDESRLGEQATTVNVSPHGARLRTRRKWCPGERPLVATESSDFQVEAKVVYCELLPDGHCCVGLEFRRKDVDWGDGAWERLNEANRPVRREK